MYSHVYNNLIHDGIPYYGNGMFLYSDLASARNTYENNIMYGKASSAMKNHCGKLNKAINNIVHKTKTLDFVYGSCNGKDSEKAQVQ